MAFVTHSPLDPPVSTISKSSSSSWSCLICFSQLWVLENVPMEVKDGTLWLEVKDETWPDMMEETLFVVEHKELELLFPADWYSQSSFLLPKIQIDNEYNLLRKQFFLFGVAYCSYTWLSIAFTNSRGGLKQLLKTWYVWVGKLKKWIYHWFIIKYKHILPFRKVFH